MNKIVLYVNKIFRNPQKIIMIPLRLGLQYIISDKLFIKLQYFTVVKRKLNLKNPKTFNEKIQWVKLYDRNPLYTQLADKYEARKFIAETIGEQHLIPLLGVWNKAEDIDFNSLPEQFVLKCTHDSKSAVICRDKSELDMEKTRKWFKKKLRQNHFWNGREWPYKNIKRRIIAEKYLEDASGGLIDYKFHCFSGAPKIMYIAKHDGGVTCSYMSMDWLEIHIPRNDTKPFDSTIMRPTNFEQMKRLSVMLSKNIPFVRVDLFEVNGSVYFNEFTFMPTNGMIPFEKEEHNELLGSWLELPIVNSSEEFI